MSVASACNARTSLRTAAEFTVAVSDRRMKTWVIPSLPKRRSTSAAALFASGLLVNEMSVVRASARNRPVTKPAAAINKIQMPIVIQGRRLLARARDSVVSLMQRSSLVMH
jgi:hypothetical protein